MGHADVGDERAWVETGPRDEVAITALQRGLSTFLLCLRVGNAEYSGRAAASNDKQYFES
jgi:hypothetical protein